MKRFLLLMLLLYSGECLNILCVFPYASYSHSVVYKPLLEKLRSDGHYLKIMGNFSLSQACPEDVILPIPPNTDKFFSVDELSHTTLFNIIMMHIVHSVIKERCSYLLNSKEYTDILKSTENYDLIITEYFISSCHITPLVQKWKAPYIVIQTNSIYGWAEPWTDAPFNPSYIPITYTKYSRYMNFCERLKNALFSFLTYVYYHNIIVPRDDDFLDLCTHCNRISSHEIVENASLILINSHFSYLNPRPMSPNVVEVGGMHITGSKHLPQHLEKWINESTHGVIYFSLGSMIKGHTFPEDKRQMFTNAFKRLPQRVLWKWENETMPGKPDNVMIDKWMPQFDVLCHPNVKAFISHGGLLGSTEAVHCGVPMIVMPQFGDQFTNAKAIESSGGGVILDYRYLDEESIYNALTTVLSPSFNKQAKELSARFKDRPLPPLETAIYWVEYVARHRGAPHLRTAAVGMPLYQYLLLDVIAFLAAILFAFIFISYYITRAFFRRLCKSGKSSEKLKEN